MQETTSQRDRLLLGGLCSVAAALFIWLRPYGLITGDEGWVAYPALRMLEGDVLYRDVFSYYAPLRFHALAVAFSLFEPSLLVMRSLWIGLLLVSVGGCYRLARRFVSPALALLPAAAYALAPGPWYKSPYGFCTVVFLLALARAAERRSARRMLLLGAAAGLSLITRQELGVLQSMLGISLAALAPFAVRAGAGVEAMSPARASEALPRLRSTACVVLGFALPTLPVVAIYARHGALGDLVSSVFVQAFAHSGGQLWGLVRFLTPEGFTTTQEGVGVAAILLLPIVFAGVAIVLVGRGLLASGLDAKLVLAIALIGHGVAAVAQGYNPPLLVRYLQSAIPFYLLSSFALGEIGPRWRPLAAAVVGFALAGQLWGVLWGAEQIHPSDAHSGSLRVLRQVEAVRVLGDELYTDAQTAEDIRLARSFFAERTREGEPIFTAPQHSLYYLILERPNATRFLSDYKIGNRAMSAEQKEREMARLLASEARYALVSRSWWLQSEDADRPILTALAADFRPVRLYGSLAILERGRAPGERAVSQRVLFHRPSPRDEQRLQAWIADRPGEPLPWELLGRLHLEAKRFEAAAAAFATAQQLDPVNPRPRVLLESARAATRR